MPDSRVAQISQSPTSQAAICPTSSGGNSAPATCAQIVAGVQLRPGTRVHLLCLLSWCVIGRVKLAAIADIATILRKRRVCSHLVVDSLDVFMALFVDVDSMLMLRPYACSGASLSLSSAMLACLFVELVQSSPEALKRAVELCLCCSSLGCISLELCAVC